MAEYISFHPDNEAIGMAVIAALLALDSADVKRLIDESGISTKQDEWHSQQEELDLLRQMEEGDYFNMIRVGMHTANMALLPPDINNVHQILSMVNDAYHMNVRGPEIGEYLYEKTGERKARMTCRSPYPSDFDYGLLYNFIKRFAGEDTNFIKLVRDDSLPNRKKGDGDTCVYNAEW